MEHLVINYRGKPCTTSRLVAEKFDKEHRSVIESIKRIVYSAQNSEQFFKSATYKDSTGKENPMYLINRDGFSLLVMGFTGEKALKFKIDFISAFNHMEKLLHANLDKITRKDLALMLYQAEQEKEQLQVKTELQAKELKEASPKVEYYDNVLQSKNSHTITTIAKELGMSGQKLNSILYVNGIQYRQDGHWVLYSQYQALGLTKTRTINYFTKEGEKGTSVQTTWTEKGRQFIHSLIKNGKRESAKLLRGQLSNAINNQAIPNNSLLRL